MVSGLIGIHNYLTNGPLLVANTELKLTRPGNSLNVRTDMRVNTLSGMTSMSTPYLTANTINIAGTFTSTDVFSNTANLTTINANTLTASYGSGSLTTANIQVANISSATINTIQVLGTVTTQSIITASGNIQGGNGTFTSMNANTGTFTTFSGTITYSNISNTPTISNTTIRSSIIANAFGLTKADVGLANVDNTSDATKNAATANLSNKTLMSPLIITGNVSADPMIQNGIASASYAQRQGTIENPIINGCMDIWQRGNTFINIRSKVYTADRFAVWNGTSQTMLKAIKSNNVPTVANAGILLTNSLEVGVMTANTTVSSSMNDTVAHLIEGYTFRSFAQQTFTLSFWVMSSKTGTHCVGFLNSSGDRSYVAEYIINNANTWEFKTITVPASPSAGTWNYTNGIGLDIRWVLVAGSSLQTTPGVWTTGSFFATANQVNCVDSTSNVFRLTAIKMELGSVVTPIKFRPYAKELALCQRYYSKSFLPETTPVLGNGLYTGEPHFSSYSGSGSINRCDTLLYPIRMRIVPQITIYSPFTTTPGTFQCYDITRGADCTSTTVHNDEIGFSVTTTLPSPASVGDEIAFHWTANAEI